MVEEIVIKREPVIHGEPDSWVIYVYSRKWVISKWQAENKERFERMIDGLVSALVNAPQAIRGAIEALKEEELYERVITIEDDPESVCFEPGGA